MQTYTQCELSRILEDNTKQVEFQVWIPSQFAKIGKILKIKREDGGWSEGWLVISTGSVWSEKQVLAYEMDYKKMPLVTDMYRDKGGKRRMPIKPKE